MNLPPSDDAAARRARAWTEYWAAGALHSCAGSYAGNYGGEIAAFWRGVFDALGDGAMVLDLCCGNAPLSKLLLEQHGSTSSVRIDAVDAALVAPAWIDALAPEARAALRVHAGVDAAALPFAAARFDLCMSQYGVEYAGLGAMREVARVLRPAGRFAAVLHHADSRPVRIARAELAHLGWLQEQGVLAAAAGMIEPMARAGTEPGRESLRHDPAANAARARFNQTMQALEARARQPFADVLTETRDALAAVLQHARAAGEQPGRAALAAVAHGLEANELRQRELVDCALDEDGVRNLLAPLAAEDLHLAPIAFAPGEIAGWGVQARRG